MELENEARGTGDGIPLAPEVVGALAPLPESKRHEWRQLYSAALKQAKVDSPGDSIAQRQAANKEANRIFRIGEITTYKQAAALEDWQLMKRQEIGGRLHIVTIDGKGYWVDVPSSVDAGASQSEGGKGKGAGK
jgi:hypothetical protein